MATDSVGQTLNVGDFVTIACQIRECDPNIGEPDIIVVPVIPATSAGDRQPLIVNALQVVRTGP